MKFSLLLLILGVFENSATVIYSQETKISLDLENVSINKVLRKISEQSEFNFLYNNNVIDKNYKFTVKVKEETVDKVLDIALNGKDLNYKIKDKIIFINKNTQSKEQQQTTVNDPPFKVSGTVTDFSTNETLPGVNIFIKGTGNGVVTDAKGNYSITVPSRSSVLVLSYIGFLTEEVVAEESVIDIELVPDIESLDEVVIVGYGKQRKETTVGSQSSITAKELQSQPIGNLSNAISGRIAGIVAVQRSGEPGYDNSEIYIRGISTFTNSDPLILVDGIERSFSNISAEDISSFTILKDASATAVYGVRGANGVILIETKKGRQGKPIINFDYNQGVTQFTKTPELAEGVTYLNMANEAYKNSNPNEDVALYSDEKISMTENGTDTDLYPNVNWVDEMFNKYGKNTRANLNASGGSESATYYLSLGYYNETGMYKTDELAKYNSSLKFTRYNFTSNLSLDLFEYTNVKFGASGWISNGNYPGASASNIWSSAFSMPPTVVPVRYSSGEFAQTRAADVSNPYALLTQSGYSNEQRNQLWSNIKITQSLEPILKGLSVYGTFSFDAFNSHTINRTKTVDTYLAIGRDDNDELILEQTGIGSNYLQYSRANGGNSQFYLESAVNYQRKFGKHSISEMILYNQSDRIDAFSDDFLSSIPYRFQGIAARSTYSYNDIYNAEVNLGYNGSETFAAGKRFGFFPSFGLSWVVSNEDFFTGISPYIQFLKFRGSYGVVGNSNIGGRRFAYIATVNDGAGGYTFGMDSNNSFSGKSIGEYAINVTWEKARKYNVGVELKTWQNALSVTVDAFKEFRSGIFLQRGDLPNYIGVTSSPWGNLGEVHNKGIESTVVLNKRINNSWIINFRGNINWNRAIVVENANAPWPYPWQQRNGRKLGQRFGKIALGLFESEQEIANSPAQTGDIKPGDIKYKDLNGDGTIDSYDEGPIGYGSMPEIVYGFGPSISYKGFALGAWFKGISNVDIFINGEGLQPFQKEGVRGNLFSNITDRWSPDNPRQDVLYPRLTYPSTSNSNYQNSSWWVKNGGFLRLQNIELSYTIRNANWLEKVGITNCRIYGIGYNVLTISEFDMWDVELGDGRGGSYPLIKSFNLGMDFQF
ncbi:MAG: TonB-dependent receptor [Salinivirgaceae bacterium]|nr:TonB-dependent receptor [Salinivirgaceae bacterium]